MALKDNLGNFAAFLSLSDAAIDDIKWWQDQAKFHHMRIDLVNPFTFYNY